MKSCSGNSGKERLIWGCPGVPAHGGIPIVFISIHGVVTQFVNVSFLCVPVHEDTTPHPVQKKQGKSKLVKKMEKVTKEGTVEEATFFLGACIHKEKTICIF